MKLFAFVGVVILLVSSSVGMSSAKMYWDGSDVTDATITDKDFQAKLPGQQATVPRVKMYDDYEVLDIDSERGARQNVPPAVRPVRRVPAGFSDQPPRRRDAGSPSAARARRPETTKAEPSITDKPKPVASAPGKGPRSGGGPTRESVQTQTSEEPESASPPAVKKMPWGQVDVKPAEPEEKKFKWGEKK